ncbi:MAG TPA: hypothetical protein VHE61_00420 [Opitutaceae bacterium]|nr:hypothetical protein [Opitutaceae bacterium]
MLRIGSMNMLLHGVENPDIRYRDSLAQDHAGEEESEIQRKQRSLRRVLMAGNTGAQNRRTSIVSTCTHETSRPHFEIVISSGEFAQAA